MKFNKYLKPEVRELLENQYREYVKQTPMTKKEQSALREWVKDGHSVFENTRDAWAEGEIPVEFLTVYRDEEYIRQQTKGMSPEETEKFVLDYYGWDSETAKTEAFIFSSMQSETEELPF